MQLAATKAPSEEMSLTNRAFMNSREYTDSFRYSTLHTGVASFIFRVDPSDKVPPGKIGFGLAQVGSYFFAFSNFSAFSVNGRIFP